MGIGASGGACAEFIAANANELALNPSSLNDGQAASIAVAGQTALLTMQVADIQAGQSILILGAGEPSAVLLCNWRRVAGRECWRCAGPEAWIACDP
jgi:D-arabinose 1-dehydrogenase-like Zn-dependent alcohol dehydrogenase